MRKLFTLLLAVAASIGTLFAWDYERVQIGDLYYNLDATNQTAEVTSQNSGYPKWSTTITTANIPASVEYNSVTYSVTSIGECAFENCSGLTSVTIPNSVTSIGTRAFYYCILLTSVEVPNSVATIGDYAFGGVKNIQYNGSSTGTPWGALSVNGYVEGNLIYGDENKVILLACLPDAQGEIEIPNSVTTIGDEAFLYCSGITSVTIPNSVTSLGESVFAACSGLTSVTISNSITSLGWSTFAECTSLTSIEIPNSITNIGIQAFAGCSGLTSIIIPQSVTNIDISAFYYCTGLTSVTIPNSVTSIGSSAFYGCTGLTSVINFASVPQTTNSTAFDNVDLASCTLYVPAENLELYQAADVWKEFGNILPIQAETTEVTQPEALPTDNSVVIAWPTIAEAAVYTIEIRKNGELVCTLVFNAQGQLLNIAFAAPSRDGNNRQIPMAPKTTTGWTYTIAGLEAHTAYIYTIIATDSSNQEVYNETIPFTTQPHNTHTDVESIEALDTPTKLLHDGQIYILRGEKVYTITGQEVK